MSNISKRTYDLNDKELDSQIASLKEYVDALISSIPKFNIEVVSELPTGKNVSFTTVYLLRGDGGTGNLYEEYICVQPPGLSGAVWEKLGTANVDLAGYAKTSDLTSGNLTVKTANVAPEATYALYASTDRSKGTIEQRLTAMGFKQGTALYNTASGGLSHGTVSYTKYGKNVVGTVWFDATKISSSAVFKTNSINIIGTDIIEGLSPNGNTFGYGLLKIEDGGYVGVSLIKSGKNVALIIYNPTSSSTIAELPASQIRYIDINIGYQTS
jgi:Fe2+ transport system protein FeoA